MVWRPANATFAGRFMPRAGRYFFAVKRRERTRNSADAYSVSEANIQGL